MTDPFLNTAELQRITKRMRFKAQCRMLENMKIPYIPDGEGEPLVIRSIIFGDTNQHAHPEPNFGALNQ